MNHSFMYGTSVFEGIRGYWTEKDEQIYIFRLREHFERMYDSMKVMYLDVKYSIDELCKIVIELVRMNGPRVDTYIRPCAFKCEQRVGPSLDDNPSDISI